MTGGASRARSRLGVTAHILLPGTGGFTPLTPHGPLSIGADCTQHGCRAPALTQEESRNAEVLDTCVVLLLVPEEGNGKEEGSEEESKGNGLYFKKKLFILE